MARESVILGYVDSVETESEFIKEERIVEKKISGQVKNSSQHMNVGSNINGEIRMTLSFSFIANPRFINHISNFRYIKYQGTKWSINTSEVQRPRVTLYLGGVYNGATNNS